jgi:phosphoribosylformimino-5-aminoimidazole carboxamide ribonucleotide (ProFAR) isomerase
VRKKYNAEPGFFTMNMPRLVEVLERVGVENPIVCASINKIGFRMCGGVEAYERTLREKKFRAVAMSVLASGAISPSEALEYVCGLKGVESIVFGASSKANIQQTKQLIEQHSRRR